MSYGSKAAERIAGKTVLITGASSGIGQATALELAEASKGNIRFILAARRIERLEESKKHLESKYENVSVYPLQIDVSKYNEVPKVLDSIPKEWANVDVLINNA